ncbi:DUF1573 domain-containing protein [Microscilla marina]|uniref:Lipoprotein, putative n=1 Tax=Microscilla marina ATCC 23134 TaxID=313606 RepID=A1ZKP2_MICM2|nr:DUF1573 domain-containing protein [Microscilla marina]EAY28858.1 lipoprotein, putative [Microscilla marina ATCC 23134]
MKRNLLLVVTLLWAFTACDSKSKESQTENGDTTATVVAGNTKESAANNNTENNNNQTVVSTTGENKTESTKPTNENDNGPKASIKFEKMTHDFGEITEGTVAKHTFTFTNSGDVPLVVKSARGSCGCTVPDWPKEPIAPGKTGEIKVQFNSQGKPGTQAKTVTLTTNTAAGTEVLNIKAQVKAVAKVNGPVKK